MLEYLAFRLFSSFAPLIPTAAGYWLCDRFGDIAWLALSRRRATVQRNLRAVLRGQTDDLGRRTRQVFREGARYYYDTFRVSALSREDFERLIVVEGWEHLERAVARGKGVVVVTAHLGSPSLVVRILAIKGCRITTVAEPVKPQRLYDLFARVREGHGITLLPLGPTSMRDLMDVLRRKEVVGIVGDRDIQRTGVPVQFFGGQITLPGGPVLLAMRTGAALIPGFSYRRRDGRFDACIWEPLEIKRTGDLRADLRLNTQNLARVLEEAIEKSPEQWVVFEPIWRDRPSRAEVEAAG